MEISFLEKSDVMRTEDCELSFIIALDSLSFLCRDLLYRNRYPQFSEYSDGGQQTLFERTTILIQVGRMINHMSPAEVVGNGFNIEKIVEPLRQLREVKSAKLCGLFKKDFRSNFIASIERPDASDEEKIAELCSIKRQAVSLFWRDEFAPGSAKFASGIAKFEILEAKAYQYSILSKDPDRQLQGGHYDGLVISTVYKLIRFTTWYRQAYAYHGRGQLDTAWKYISQITDRSGLWDPTGSSSPDEVLCPSDHARVFELRAKILEAQSELEENKTNPQQRLDLLRLAVTDFEQASNLRPDRCVATVAKERLEREIENTLISQGQVDVLSAPVNSLF